MTFSLRTQIALVWWSLAFAVIFGLSLAFLLHMVPPPDPSMSAEEIKSWYGAHDSSIQIGAMISGWTSAFLVPLTVVIAAQMRRHESGFPVWSMLTLIAGGLTSIFLVLPPIAFGTAAYSPGRGADATALMHEFGLLSLVTTDMFYIFAWVALIVISLRPHSVRHSPFRRWYGYFNIWLVSLFELGAIAYTRHSGPFSWNGLVVFWVVFALFGAWIGVTAFLLQQSLARQLAEAGVDSSDVDQLRPAGQPLPA